MQSLCLPGFVSIVHGVCQEACTIGKVCSSNATQHCAFCLYDTFRDSVAQLTCVPCPQHSNTLVLVERTSLLVCVCVMLDSSPCLLKITPCRLVVPRSRAESLQLLIESSLNFQSRIFILIILTVSAPSATPLPLLATKYITYWHAPTSAQ